ncbi:type II secretion system F family protein [Kutzneria sp. 744]|uniref:type II secretion system F family protein n=1 Tax=Kutzneria sp. (strain 744) TaxID=345341 RepID=UPI0003EEA7E2|nr:type II secretion system F family protein [Kutzneria sp. 744]EWM15273.1 integral membrane protein [Kutzneria sp. 744]
MAAAALGAGVVAWTATGWPVGGIAVAAGVYAGPKLLHPSGARQVMQRREALAEWIQRLAGLLAAGTGGIEDAIGRSARTAPAALADRVSTLAFRIRSMGAEPALRAFADDLADGEVDALVASLILRVRDGGAGLVEVLQARAVTLRQQVQAELGLEAERQRPRTQMVIIMGVVAVTVVGLLAGSRLLDSYRDLEGQLWVGVVAVIWAAAFALAYWLTRPACSSRFLIDDRAGGRR